MRRAVAAEAHNAAIKHAGQRRRNTRREAAARLRPRDPTCAVGPPGRPRCSCPRLGCWPPAWRGPARAAGGLQAAAWGGGVPARARVLQDTKGLRQARPLARFATAWTVGTRLIERRRPGVFPRSRRPRRAGARRQQEGHEAPAVRQGAHPPTWRPAQDGDIIPIQQQEAPAGRRAEGVVGVRDHALLEAARQVRGGGRVHGVVAWRHALPNPRQLACGAAVGTIPGCGMRGGRTQRSSDAGARAWMLARLLCPRRGPTC